MEEFLISLHAGIFLRDWRRGEFGLGEFAPFPSFFFLFRFQLHRGRDLSQEKFREEFPRGGQAFFFSSFLTSTPGVS